MADTFVEAILVGTSLVGVLVFLITRWQQKKGIGVRAIQFTALLLLVPLATLLALRGIIGSEAIATLFGAIAGYVLATIGETDKADGKGP